MCARASVRARACVCERLHVRERVGACVFAHTGHMRAHVKLCMYMHHQQYTQYNTKQNIHA